LRITAIETLYLAGGITVHAGPIQWLWVRIHTENGLYGLGETYPHPGSEEAVIHSRLASRLLGQDARRIEGLWASMFDAVSYSGWAGAEMRAISAVDTALWDLKAKWLGLHRNGRCWTNWDSTIRSRIRVAAAWPGHSASSMSIMR
jgi:L-alanine-DL-glutamate epimerase-like enolase superfamily enzyme